MQLSMGITIEDLGGRLFRLDLRGKPVDLQLIEAAAKECGAEVVLVDPSYRLDASDETDPVARKQLMNAFSTLAATGKLVIFSHHDAKGSPGDRNLADRGSGSSVANRHVDATLALSPWGGTDPDAGNLVVLEILCRNQAPRPAQTLRFEAGAFHLDPRTPIVQTARNRNQTGHRGAGGESDVKKLAQTVRGPCTSGYVRGEAQRMFGRGAGGRAFDLLAAAPGDYGLTVKRDGPAKVFNLLNPLEGLI